MNCELQSQKGDYVVWSLYKGSTHMLEIFLQDKRDKTYPGAIWMDLKGWNMLKDTVNEGRVDYFW